MSQIWITGYSLKAVVTKVLFTKPLDIMKYFMGFSTNKEHTRIVLGIILKRNSGTD
jgi:hypothetical protein